MPRKRPVHKSQSPPDLRPIPARLLKSLGDTLRPLLSGSSVLDLYAGEGRFGRMALHEGAAKVDFVELNQDTAAGLKKTLQKEKHTAGRVFAMDSTAFLTRTTESFDIVFADPPFKTLTPESVLDVGKHAHSRLAPEGIFLVKHPSQMVLSVLPGYRTWKSTSVGDATVSYFVRLRD